MLTKESGLDQKGDVRARRLGRFRFVLYVEWVLALLAGTINDTLSGILTLVILATLIIWLWLATGWKGVLTLVLVAGGLAGLVVLALVHPLAVALGVLVAVPLATAATYRRFAGRLPDATALGERTARAR